MQQEVSDSQITQINLTSVQAQPPDSDSALIWWPLMITHFIEGGVPGTDVLFQAAPGETEDTTILRVFLVEGTKAQMKWENAQGVIVTRDLALGEYMSFRITGSQVVEELAPTDSATDTEMAEYMALTESIFDEATN